MTGAGDSQASPCGETVRRLVEGDLTDWSGLPVGCLHQDLTAVLRGGEAEGNGQLSGVPLRFRMYESPHQSDLIEAWFAGEEPGVLLLLTFREPKLQEDPATLLERLGAPEGKIDAWVGREADADQWVYASRGLTLFVRENNQIARIAAYPPVSVSYYEEYLGAYDKREYLPRPDWL